MDLGDRGGGVCLRGVEGGGTEVRMYCIRIKIKTKNYYLFNTPNNEHQQNSKNRARQLRLSNSQSGPLPEEVRCDNMCRAEVSPGWLERTITARTKGHFLSTKYRDVILPLNPIIINLLAE